MTKRPLSPMALRDMLTSKVPREGTVRFEGMDFPIAFTPAGKPTNKLLIKFHGAVNRKTRPLPIFAAPDRMLEADWHQISISDPLLYIYDNLWISWFCGDTLRDVQSALTPLIRETADHLECDTRVYLGSSGGGFCALLCSARDPGSVALAMNPQTVLENYNPDAVRKYVSICWPENFDINEVSRRRVVDLTEVYRAPPGNTVIYLQNCTDPHHLHQHFAPFLSAVATRRRSDAPIDFIPDVSFWGRVGHQAVPVEVYRNWLEVVAAAKNTSGDAILRARAEQITRMKTAITLTDSPAKSGSFTKEDVAVADAISKWSTQ